MDALVMCGGEGSRLDAHVEKPQLEIGGVAMVDRVLGALTGSQVETVYVATSPNAPATREHLQAVSQSRDVQLPNGTQRDQPAVTLLETPGSGYVDDLLVALESDAPSSSTPVLTVAADVPLLGSDVVDRVLDRYRRLTGDASVRGRHRTDRRGDEWSGREGNSSSEAPIGQPSLTVCVPTSLKRRLGFTVETTLEERPHLAPTGVNVVGDTDSMTVTSYDARLAANVNRLSDARAATALLGDGGDLCG